MENLWLLRDAINPFLNWCSFNLLGQSATILRNLYQIIGHIKNRKRTWLISVSYLSSPFLSLLCSGLWRSQGGALWGRWRIHFDLRQDFSCTNLSSFLCLSWPCFLLPSPFQHTFHVVFSLLSSIARQNHPRKPICTRILAGPRFLAGVIWIFKECRATAVPRAGSCAVPAQVPVSLCARSAQCGVIVRYFSLHYFLSTSRKNMIIYPSISYFRISYKNPKETAFNLNNFSFNFSG